MPVVYCGNRNAVQHRRTDDDDEVRRVPHPGKHCTRVEIPDGTPIVEALTTITSGRGVWAAHSDDPAPAWVASDDPQLASVLAEHWGCELRDPEPAGDGAGTSGKETRL